MLHLETKLLKVLPLLPLLPVVHHNIRLLRTGGGSKTDPPRALVLDLLLYARFDAPDELLYGLE